jgi:hypothetical protein
LKLGIATVNRDISYLRRQAKNNEYEKCLVGVTSILKEAWDTAVSTSEKREKTHALSLVEECYAMKLDLLTNVMIVEDAKRFVTSYTVAAAEKDSTDYCVTVNEENTSNDIQRSDGNRNTQSTIAGDHNK